MDYVKRDGQVVEDEQFYAEQNARLVANAERYYRSMFGGRTSSWNLRDTHMVETIEALVSHLDRFHAPTKVVVWAHNSHLGDAGATEMGQAGEINVGRLMRSRHGDDAVLIGFSTYGGTVTAASDWGGAAERKTVRPGRPDSYEALFHDTWEGADGMVVLRENKVARQLLDRPRLERAIGVIYRPETERMSHYFHARLAEQFDAMIHIDHTRAVEPLERTAGWTRGELPETYPTGV
jgi:erythromycin esterase-like protein